MSIMTVRDLEQVQTAFTEAGLDYQLELENGKISIRGKSSEEIICRYATAENLTMIRFQKKN